MLYIHIKYVHYSLQSHLRLCLEATSSNCALLRNIGWLVGIPLHSVTGTIQPARRSHFMSFPSEATIISHCWLKSWCPGDPWSGEATQTQKTHDSQTQPGLLRCSTAMWGKGSLAQMDPAPIHLARLMPPSNSALKGQHHRPTIWGKLLWYGLNRLNQNQAVGDRGTSWVDSVDKFANCCLDCCLMASNCTSDTSGYGAVAILRTVLWWLRTISRWLALKLSTSTLLPQNMACIARWFWDPHCQATSDNFCTSCRGRKEVAPVYTYKNWARDTCIQKNQMQHIT